MALDPLARLQEEADFMHALHQRLEQIAQQYRMADMPRDQLEPLVELSTTALMRADELRQALTDAAAEAHAADMAALAAPRDVDG